MMEFSIAGSIVFKRHVFRKKDTFLTYELYNIKFQFLNVKCVFLCANDSIELHNFVKRKKLGVAVLFSRCIY